MLTIRFFLNIFLAIPNMFAESSEKDNQDIKRLDEQTKDPSEIIKTIFGEEFDSNKKYVIAIQGVTTSGKTTLSSCLFDLLSDNKERNTTEENTTEEKTETGLKPLRISTDHFYKDNPFAGKSKKSIDQYDFDNPKAIDWTAMKSSLCDILKGSKEYLKSSYSFITKRRTENLSPNPGFNIIIIEGIFAHNLFQEYSYNVDELDAFNSKKEIKNPLVKNEFYKILQNNDIKFIKIFMNLDRDRMLQTRIVVDYRRSNWDAKTATEMFESKVYPATLKWVMPSGKNIPDIFIEDGSRNIDFCVSLIKEITAFFGKRYDDDEIRTHLIGLIDTMSAEMSAI